MEAERIDSPLEVCAVDPIAIPDHIAGCRLPRERLDHLLGGPLGGWVCGRADVEHSSSLQAQDHEHEEQPEGRRRHDREVNGDRLPKMIPKERAPSLRGWFPMAWEILRDRRLGEVESELQELAVNPWGAPGWIRSMLCRIAAVLVVTWSST